MITTGLGTIELDIVRASGSDWISQITSTEDCNLILQADRDNDDENKHAWLTCYQDGTARYFRCGVGEHDGGNSGFINAYDTLDVVIGWFGVKVATFLAASIQFNVPIATGVWQATDVGIEYLDEVLHDLLNYGSDNAGKIACISEGGSIYAAINFTCNTNGFANAGGNDYEHYFDVPLSCLKGTKKLYITAIRSYVLDGDAGDYITATYLRGYIGATRSTVETDLTNIGDGGAQDRTWTFGAARDCGAYEWVRVYYSIVSTTRNDLDYNAPVVTYYYA